MNPVIVANLGGKDLEIEQQDSPRFIEAIRRISEDERQKLRAQLAKLPEKDKAVRLLLRALDLQDWNDPVFQDESFPLYALEALRIGKMTQMEFGTVCLYWSALQYHRGNKEIIAIPLFNPDKTVNTQAEKILLESLASENPTSAEIAAIFDRMRDLPPSEQQFFIMPDLQEKSMTPTVSQAIYTRTGITPFNRLAGKRRMLPTIGLMQTYLAVHHQGRAVTINPVLGISSLQDIAHKGIDGTCDLAVHFPGVALPPSADNSPAPWYDFSYHDFYHAILASGIPEDHRALFVRIADVVENFKTKVPAERRAIGAIKAGFIDMEFFEYRPEFADGLEYNHLFWKSVAQPFIVQETSGNQPQLTDKTRAELLIEIAQQVPLESSVGQGPLGALLLFAQAVAAQIDDLTESEAAEYEVAAERHPLRYLTETWVARMEESVQT